MDVVVTGRGVVCHLGDDLPSIERELREGKTRPFQKWEPAEPYESRCPWVGLYRGPLDDGEKSQLRFMGRAARLAFHAARKALKESGLERRDFAVIIGSGTGDVDALLETHQRLARAHSSRRVSPTAVPRMMASTVSASLATALSTSGPAFGVSAACAAGALNLGVAASLIEAGQIDAALAGGAEAADSLFHAGFEAMRAYASSGHELRPYAADRSGFIFGEGAGVVVLESLESARARGARIYGRLAGQGLAGSSGEMVAPSSAGTLAAMRRALRHARLSPDQIDYVNTHATGTPEGDPAEVHALRELFGRVAYSSIKGYTGHTVSASGAIEAILTWSMLEGGWIAPSANAEPLDPEFAADPPVIGPTTRNLKWALSNSIGFGGTSACLVLGRAD